MSQNKQISKEERQLRKEAIEYATASVQLEGFKFPLGDKELVKAFIDGEIELDELTARSLDLLLDDESEQLQKEPEELNGLVSSITEDNIHAEVDFGRAVGNEFPQDDSSSNIPDEDYESKK